MYIKETNTGQEVKFTPEDKELASLSMEVIDGTGVPSEYSIPEDTPIKLDQKIASRVNRHYNRCNRLRFEGLEDDVDFTSEEEVNDAYEKFKQEMEQTSDE